MCRFRKEKRVYSAASPFHLLYVSDGERRRICQLSGELPIDETIHLDGLTGGDKVCITWEVEDLNLHLINSRKLGVRAIVTLHAWIEELCDLAVPMEIRGESDVAVKRQEYRVVELAVQKKDVLRVKKELTIPSGKPELHEILWQDLEVRGLDLRSEEGRVSAQGELFVFCLYSDGEEDHPLQWVEQALPFQAEVECQGCISEMIPRIESTLGQTTLEIQPDSDGEERSCRRRPYSNLTSVCIRKKPYHFCRTFTIRTENAFQKCRRRLWRAF